MRQLVKAFASEQAKSQSVVVELILHGHLCLVMSIAKRELLLEGQSQAGNVLEGGVFGIMDHPVQVAEYGGRDFIERLAFVNAIREKIWLFALICTVKLARGKVVVGCVGAWRKQSKVGVRRVVNWPGSVAGHIGSAWICNGCVYVGSAWICDGCGCGNRCASVTNDSWPIWTFVFAISGFVRHFDVRYAC